MSDTPINQTQFVSEAPVPDVPKLQEIKPDTGEGNIKKPISLPIFIGVITIIVVALGGALYYSQRQTEHVIATPVPLATEVPIETSGIHTEIQPYFDQINNLNPETNDHPFPPVDFTVRMKDPNASQ